MRSDEGIAVACKEEHVAVLNKNVGLFDINSERQIDERIVSYQDIILQVKRPQGGHIGVSVIFCEVLYGDAGL